MFGAAFLKFSTSEWLVLLLIISFVLALELINTAIEAVVDLVSPEIKDSAKIAKDTAAAAVFLSAITAVIVGWSCFCPDFFPPSNKTLVNVFEQIRTYFNKIS